MRAGHSKHPPALSESQYVTVNMKGSVDWEIRDDGDDQRWQPVWFQWLIEESPLLKGLSPLAPMFSRTATALLHLGLLSVPLRVCVLLNPRE